MTTIALCEHIHDNGSTCGSPALTGYDLCYFHQRLRFPRHRPGDFEYKLPPLDHPHSILMAIQHITQAALDGILETSRARLVLSALRLAQTTYKEMQKAEAKKNADVKTKTDVETKTDLEAKTNVAPGKKDVVTTSDVEVGKNGVGLGEDNVGIGKEDVETGLIDVGTGALARATRAQLAVPAHATDQPAPATTVALSSPPAVGGEGSASSAGEQSAPASTSLPSVATGKNNVGTGALARGPQHAKRDGVVARATRAQLAVPAPATDQPALLRSTQRSRRSRERRVDLGRNPQAGREFPNVQSRSGIEHHFSKRKM